VRQRQTICGLYQRLPTKAKGEKKERKCGEKGRSSRDGKQTAAMLIEGFFYFRGRRKTLLQQISYKNTKNKTTNKNVKTNFVA